jgi:putative addiction module killer protein
VIELRKYVDARGRCPLDAWLFALKDFHGRARIEVRIRRLSLGLQGDWKPVGDGVREMRIPVGPGYRVYYAWDGPRIVVLLAGGDKSSQRRDIERARHYWRDYRDRA